MKKIYLASKSPRRQILLSQINIDFEIIDIEIDESVNRGEIPLNYVRRMSIEKAKAGWDSEKKINDISVLAADTSIAINDKILGKPEGRKNAHEMLSFLSGKTHQVITCVSLILPNFSGVKKERQETTDRGGIDKLNMKTIDSITNVSFMDLSSSNIEEYLKTDEWIGKAGSYAIQGYAAKYIKAIEGSYSGVVGLPLYETNQLLNSVRSEHSLNEMKCEV